MWADVGACERTLVGRRGGDKELSIASVHEGRSEYHASLGKLGGSDQANVIFFLKLFILYCSIVD